MLIQLQVLPVEAATYEDYDEMLGRFPNFTLEDKCILEGIVNDKNPIWRSAMIKAHAWIMAQVDDEVCKSQEEKSGGVLEQLGEVMYIEEP